MLKLLKINHILSYLLNFAWCLYVYIIAVYFLFYRMTVAQLHWLFWHPLCPLLLFLLSGTIFRSKNVSGTHWLLIFSQADILSAHFDKLDNLGKLG